MVEETRVSGTYDPRPDAMAMFTSGFAGVALGASESDLQYYRMRAAQEAATAIGPQDERARSAHREMAKRYCDRVRGIEAGLRAARAKQPGAAMADTSKF